MAYKIIESYSFNYSKGGKWLNDGSKPAITYVRNKAELDAFFDEAFDNWSDCEGEVRRLKEPRAGFYEEFTYAKPRWDDLDGCDSCSALFKVVEV